MSPAFLRPITAVALVICIAASVGCSLMGHRDSGVSLAYRSVATFSRLDGQLKEPFGIAFRDGAVYISDGEAGSVRRLERDGTASVVADGLNTPSAIAFLANGDLVVADTGSHTIKKISVSGAVEIIAGVENVAGSADGTASSATFNGPVGVAVSENDGDIYIADTYNDRIRLIRNGQVTTLAGSVRGFADGSGADARFDTPLGIAVWNDKLLVADSGNKRIRLVDPTGDVLTAAGSGAGNLQDGSLSQASFVMPTAVAIDGHRVFIADGNAIRVIGRRAFPFVETITDARRGYVDGPSRRARFNRPSGIAIGSGGELFISDSDNQAVRVISDGGFGREITRNDIDSHRMTASEFRQLQPPRWPYDPPMNPREVAGTLGEIRGEVSGEKKPTWFHNGLDIAGAYGEVAKFIRSETVLDPHSAQNFGTSRELLRLPTVGYIHLRLGRDKDDNPLGDPRFQFDHDISGKLIDIRVPRGARFNAGETLGTLNAMNHVHLIAGRSGSEMNALDALAFPGIGDSIPPVIERVELLGEDWSEGEDERIRLGEKRRIVVDAYDRMDGNAERRRLGVYRLGYQVLSSGAPLSDTDWTIVFDRMPSNEAVSFAYAPGSRSGATGVTRFRYIVSNRIGDEGFSESFLDSAALGPGTYTLRVYAADYFGNTASKDISFAVIR